MGVAAQLQADLAVSMKARDELRTATIRMALAALRTEEVSGKAVRQLTEEEALTVVAREAKKRREAAEAFRAGGREDRAERELAEGAVLDGYLPVQMSDDELAALVERVLAETGAAGPAQLGVVMKAVTPRVAGRAEGRRVATEVRRRLAL